jgi:hypothetical protein
MLCIPSLWKKTRNKNETISTEPERPDKKREIMVKTFSKLIHS